MADVEDSVAGEVERALTRASRRRPGVLVGAFKDEEEVVRAGGTLTDDAVVEIGSVTKVFTATLLAEAVVREEVDWQTPVRELLPAGVAVPERDGVQISLEHLATHRSGLPRVPHGLGLVAGTWEMLRGRDPYAGFGEDDLLAGLGDTRLERSPGSGRPAYSNTGYALLGLALARAAGRSYDDLVRERVCLPLGLVDTVTTVTATAGHRGRWVTGTHGRGRPAADWDSGGISPAGGLRSTVRDMVAFLRSQVDPEATPLGPAIRLTQQPRYGRAPDLQCPGWLCHQGTPSLWWHNGGTGGFRALVAFAPEERAGVVVLTPCTRGVDILGLRLLRGLTGH